MKSEQYKTTAPKFISPKTEEYFTLYVPSTSSAVFIIEIKVAH